MKVMRRQWKKGNGGYLNFLQLKESFTAQSYLLSLNFVKIL